MGKLVECSEHGKQPETFVCQHVVQSLYDRKPRGFWWSKESLSKRPDAWCSECESRLRNSGGEWTPENEEFAGVRLLCGVCYDSAKEINLGKTKKWWQLWK